MAGAKGGGAWKVAYADFVTAMMAFFLVMWLMGADEETREAVAEYFRDNFTQESQETRGKGSAPESRPMVVPPQVKTGERVIEDEVLKQAAEKLAEALQNSPEMADTPVRFEFLADGMRLTVLDRSKRPLFRPGTPELTEFGQWVLRSIAWQIERFPLGVEVEGHLQRGVESQTGGFPLSTARAEAARQALESNGLAKERFWRVTGYADRKPLDGEPAAGEDNRRIAVLLKVRDGGDVEALKAALSGR